MTDHGAEARNLVWRRVAALALIVLVLCVFVAAFLGVVMTPNLRDRVDLWFVGIALAVGILMFLMLLVVTIKTLSKGQPKERVTGESETRT